MVVWTLLLFMVTSALGARVSLCPTSCTCEYDGTNLEARCTWFDFIKKFPFREQLVTLNLNNASLTKVNANLNIFPNLKHLNLSSNKIQHISATFLPQSLEVLDVSSNSIKYVPHDLHVLPHLKNINFGGNPILCDCESVTIRKELLNNGVILQPAKCEYPKEHNGKMWQSILCKEKPFVLFDGMQGDAPYEGSGSEDETEKSEDIDQEFIRPDLVTETTKTTTEVVQLEGSGEGEDSPSATNETAEDYEEGSADNATDVIEPLIVPHHKSELDRAFVKPCNFDCSSPTPLEHANETSDLPAPNFGESIQIIASDLGIIDETKQELTSPAIEISSTVAITNGSGSIHGENEELTTAKTRDLGVEQNFTSVVAFDNYSGMNEEMKEDPSLSTETTIEHNVKKATSSESNASYIFVAIFVCAIACLVGYVLIKKRSAARRLREQCEDKRDAEEEMKLFTKPETKPENANANGSPEAVPLINGSKENKSNEKEDVDVSLASIKEPEPKKEDAVQLRKTEDKIMTPEAQRVTIKAGEIPNSTPKTPVLVIRHRNSDGSFVTTSNSDQRV